MKKIILIHNIITPTRTKLFNDLNNKFKAEWYDFKILFTSETENNRKWNTNIETKKFKFKYEILKGKKITNIWFTKNHFFHINKNINNKIEKENPDIVIHAWRAWLSAFQTCRWAKKHKRKFILWSWSTKHEKSRRRTITKPLVKWLVKNSNSFRSYGTRASEYLISLWANPRKIFKLYNTVDIDFFVKKAEELKSQKEQFKKELWLKNKYNLLFIWQLIERKWIVELLEWYNLFRKNNKIDLWLIIVGSWPKEEQLKNIIKEKKIPNVCFCGYQQKSKISKHFACSDIFTLPSHEEVWGLVINEAMCFWLPILTTHTVWASIDLIKEWENWYIIKKINSKEISKWIKKIFNKDLINSNKSLELIDKLKINKILEKLTLNING